MPKEIGKKLFTYAAITDTHLNQGETESNSEFEVNKLANGRMRHVVQDLNRRELAFVIHLGDLLHPVPAVPDLYRRAAEQFKEQVAELRHPLHVLPGNHDIGDKPVDWGPMGIVHEDFVELWQEHFGSNYRAFDHGDCRFILFDAQIINSGLAIEAEQQAWLEAELDAASGAGKRIFLNCHYPPFLTYPDEQEHYDNLADPGRGWLLNLMQRHSVEVLFAGHVHNVWYNRYCETDCYLLPSTAFIRLDYSDIYRIAPTPDMEWGRNDTAKLGYFLVHVCERGHFCEWVRTYGEVSKPGSLAETPRNRVRAVHSLQNPNTRFGLDMRQNWLEVTEVAPSGALDEFDRKPTRNDYALMALLGMGVRRVRIPVRDVLDPDRRGRLHDCARQGIRFTLFSSGMPSEGVLEAVSDARGLIDMWEIGSTLEKLPSTLDAVSATARAAGISLYVSKFRSLDEVVSSGEKYYHTTNHGFVPGDADQLAQLAEWKGLSGAIFRVPGEQSPWHVAREIDAICRATGLKASLHVRMSMGSPGAAPQDDAWVAQRVAEALAVSTAYSELHVYSDTFADVDRGYYRRHGVVDRFFNPRPAFHVLRHMNGLFAEGLGNQADGVFAPYEDDLDVSFGGDDGMRYCLVSTDRLAAKRGGAGELIDLTSGERVAATQGDGGSFEPPVASGPHLWMAGG